MLLGASLRPNSPSPAAAGPVSSRQTPAVPVNFGDIGSPRASPQVSVTGHQMSSVTTQMTMANTQPSFFEFALHDIQKKVGDIKEFQEKQYQLLSHFFLGDSHFSDRTQGVGNFTQRCESLLGEVLRKMNTLEEKVHQIVPRSMTAVEAAQPVLEEVHGKGAPLATTQVSVKHDGAPDNAPHLALDTSLARGITKERGSFTPRPDFKEDRTNWASFQKTIKGQGHKHSRLYKDLMAMSTEGKNRSFWHDVFRYAGLASFLATDAPNTDFAKVVYGSTFNCVSGALVLANACLIGYETDTSIKVALDVPGANEAEWTKTADMIFNVVFAIEVSLRMIALRSWFFVAPGDWPWNLMDLTVLILSFLSDLLLGVNLTFMRSLRVLRAVRAVRLIRVLRAFRELRKMLLAMLASVRALLWVFIFLAMVMYMVSCFLLQGLAVSLKDIRHSAEYADNRIQLLPWYGSLAESMFSLVRAITGGAEWYEMYTPLGTGGFLAQAIFLCYVVFVMVGLMNILTGIFLGNIGDIADKDLVIQDYLVQVEGFVKMMLDMFRELDKHHSGQITWESFMEAVDNDMVQAYMASHGLSTLQAGLIFDLLDEKHDGAVDVFDFVFGVSRLKGSATAVDVEVIMREIGILPELINDFGQNRIT